MGKAFSGAAAIQVDKLHTSVFIREIVSPGMGRRKPELLDGPAEREASHKAARKRGGGE
jgi:hypothetical protein